MIFSCLLGLAHAVRSWQCSVEGRREVKKEDDKVRMEEGKKLKRLTKRRNKNIKTIEGKR